MTSCRSATQVQCCTIDRSLNRTIWEKAGWALILPRHSTGRRRSSMMPPCRQSGAIRAAEAFLLGLGTGLGSTLIVDGIVQPMELAHLPYKKATYEDYVGVRGLEEHGKARRGGSMSTTSSKTWSARIAAGGCRARRRQRKKAEGIAAFVPTGRQRQCIQGWISHVAGALCHARLAPPAPHRSEPSPNKL